MIELKDYDYNLLKRIEKANCTDYGIVEVKDHYYITIEELLTCLSDTQDQRDYAEENLIKVSEEYDKKYNEYIPTVDKHYIDEINKLKEENENLKEDNEILRDRALMVCNEDMLDQLAMEGVQL